MDKYNDIEKAFIKDQLAKHGDYLVDLFVEAIENKDLIKTGDLLEHFQTNTAWNVKETAFGIELQMNFPDHGRFIEIAEQKKKKGIRTENVDLNSLIWGIRKPRKRGRKAKNAQWYTRNIFGAQQRLITRIMYGLSDVERERIKQQLQKKETIS